jgi:hypothetical protein
MIFKGRKLVIATMHNKDKVIAPLLEKHLGVSCITASQLNTDSYGTFSGEVERKLSPLEVLRQKCNAAMDLENCDLAIASEGSFGCHPNYYFTQADDEFVMFIDRRHTIEIVERELSVNTNLNASYINNIDDLLDFAEKCQFPSHGLILKNKESGYTYLEKGISSKERLIQCFNECISIHGSVFIETDMRAMYNPTRMKVIERATEKLCEKINSKCPNCLFPGYSVQRVLSGLPCVSCSLPTKSTKALVFQCTSCLYEEIKEFPHGKQVEDPMYCDFCNP